MLEYPKALVAFLENTLGIPEHHQLAYGSTFLISFAPFLLLFLIRVENTPAHRNYLRIALSFASGGLLGDAFIHLIPHAISPHHHHEESHGHGHDHAHDHHGHDHSHDHGHHHHDHDHGHSHAHDHHGHDHAHHDHAHEHAHAHGHAHDHGHDHFQQTMVGLYIVCGVIFFFLMEKFIIFLKGGSGHGHSHSHDAPLKKKSKSNKPKKAKQSDDEGDDDDKPLIASGGEQKNRAVSGFLNLFADFLHNFTDGLAIGATFSTTKSMGAITAFSIFAHEIPHEIGDYAILIQAGYKRSSAIGLQLVTAIGAMIGTYVGLHFGTMDQATTFILPITAGGFIYIATVSIIPELLEKTHSYIQAAAELIALGTGVAMMFWIALNE